MTLSRYLPVTLVLVATLVSIDAHRPGFAQAGSAGGTVGEQNKSVSGSEDQPTPHHQQNPGLTNSEGSHVSAPSSISGRWTWTETCNDGSQWAGTFEFTQDSSGAVSGTAAGNDGSGPISGLLTGNRFAGSRSYPAHSTPITLVVSGSSLRGLESSRSHGICRYQARKG
jgi:hypothetical protein